ncbi:MAG: VWA domain-containing protein [Candidatus Omnitrophica bacterium]|nr:VWA domain-containing protein [Candidatus Omnitrophota bacterium]
MQFYASESLLYLFLLPVILFLFWVAGRGRRRRLERIGYGPTLSSKLMPAVNPSQFKIKAFYLAAAVFFCVLALARPQWGEEKRKIERKGIDVIFLLDTSLSMLAEDIKPNRLEKSKLEIKSMLRELKGDRVGIIAFAGSGFLQAPLTLDYSAFLLFLDAIKTGYIPDPGTSLARALELTLNAFPKENLKHKAVVVFSDGEDHEGGVEPVLEQIKKAGIRVYTLGVGTAKGDPIPLKDERGRKTGFKKDTGGQIVITRLNQPLLEKVAQETGGLYLPSTPGEKELGLLLKHMESLGKKQIQEKLITEKENHYQIFLAFALIFLILESFVPSRRKMPVPPAVLLLFLITNSGFLDSPKSLTDKGNKDYKEKKYQSALKDYREAQVKKPEDPTIRYNLANALYQTESYQEAKTELEKSIAQAKDPKLKAQAYYNYGNTQYRLGNFDEAIEAYEKALEIDSKDVDAKYNLEFLQKKKSMFEKKNEDKKQDQKEKQQQPQQQDQQQQDQQQQQEQQQQQQNQEQQKDSQDQESEGSEEKEQKGEEEKEDSQQKEEEQNKKDQEKQSNEPGQEEQDRPQEEEPKQQDPKDRGQDQPRPDQGDQEQKAGRKPLQGQMSMQNALQLLDALKESERELQDLRKPPPPPQGTPQVARDW